MSAQVGGGDRDGVDEPLARAAAGGVERVRSALQARGMELADHPL